MVVVAKPIAMAAPVSQVAGPRVEEIEPQEQVVVDWKVQRLRLDEET